MKSYQCVQCDQRFQSDDKRPRCPKCMRVNGLQEVSERDDVTRNARTRWVGVAAVVVLGLVGLVAYMRSAKPHEGAEQSPEPEALEDLASVLSEQGADAEVWADMFQPDEGLETWAEALGEVRDPVAAAARLKKALRSGDGGNFGPLDLVEPRKTPPMTAAAAFAAFSKGDRAALYPLEVATIAATAMRAQGVDALVAEVAALENDQRPLDPSGCLGYFVLAVAAEQGGYRFVDVYGGRNLPASLPAATVLSDAQAVAHALGISALTRLAAQRDPQRALREVESGLRLAPKSPVLRSVRAVALAANGGVKEGEDAARAALQLRSDAPRYNQLATYLLQLGDADGAEKAVAKALSLSPKYPSAFVTLASVHLLRGQLPAALAALEQASQLSPALPGLDMAYVQYHAANGELDVAIDLAERAIAKRAQEPQFYLTLGRLYMAVGRTADMQSCARKVIELSPPERQAKMEKVIAAVLGPDALTDEGGDPGVSATQPAVGL